jgi:pyridoxamine 5'-phosphate oxidase
MSKHIDRLRDDHKEFGLNALNDAFEKDPVKAFQAWFDEACSTEQPEPNAFALSTLNIASKQPSSRIVYLKELTKGSLVFYTNYESDKAKDIQNSSNVGALFFWPGLQRQIRIEGVASKITAQESDDYFQSRPRSSQIGAWASDQSRYLSSRKELEDKLEALNKKFSGDVERPPFWGGYGILPKKFEFWQGRPSRLHDRIVFEKVNGVWESYRINP